VLFEVATDVLVTWGTLFVPNSASSDFSAAELGLMTGLDGAVAIFDPDGMKVRPQSEAWIPRRIPRAAIRQVFVRDEAALTDLLSWPVQPREVQAKRIGIL
jgi:hypothetical protein